jgi:hypothetical protein
MITRVTRLLCEKSPKMLPKPMFSSKCMHNFIVVKCSPKISHPSVILKKLPKVYTRPTCENSPNLVTLIIINVSTYINLLHENNDPKCAKMQFIVRRRIARWLVFKPKITIWVNFGEPLNGNCWLIYDHLVYFMAIWYTLWPFCTVCGHLLNFS